jgi:hypothetical protein
MELFAWGSDVSNKEFCGLPSLRFKKGKSHLWRHNNHFLPHPIQFTTQLSHLSFKAKHLELMHQYHIINECIAIKN